MQTLQKDGLRHGGIHCRLPYYTEMGGVLQPVLYSKKCCENSYQQWNLLFSIQSVPVCYWLVPDVTQYKEHVA